MSRPLKQTKLDLTFWKKRPQTDDSQNGGRSVRQAPYSSTYSSDGPLQNEGSPSSGAALSQPFPESQQEPKSATPSFSIASSPDLEATNTLPALQIHTMKTASFSFTSSELPLSTSSQRIVRNGERMVTNSEEDDDSSSLEDLDSLMRPSELQKSEDFPERESNGLWAQSRKSRRASSRAKNARDIPHVPKVSEYKYSLAMLAEQQRELQNSGENVAMVNAILEARRQPWSRDANILHGSSLPSESVIDAVMNRNCGEEDADRLKDALRRTEALHHDNSTWSFFQADFEETFNPPSFPALEEDQLRRLLQDTGSRQQAFLNGYIEDYAVKKDLPDELLFWIIESTCSERREDLRLAYVHVLAELGVRNCDLLNSKGIDKLFQRIGARAEALEVEKPVVPCPAVSRGKEGTMQDHLPSALGLIQSLSGTLRPDSILHAICIMCRLLLDHQVLGNCSLMTAVDETLNGLIESLPEMVFEQVLHKTLVTVYRSLCDPSLRLQLVRNLPVYEFRTAVFRRRLALAFFFQDTGYLKKPAEKPNLDLTSTAVFLQNPRFKIWKQTDYAELTASIAMLDIAVDAGDHLPLSTNEDKRVFDASVDLLSRRLKDLSSQIVGATALNMQRTEAKEILNAIQRRLSYSVRSTPPPTTTILVNAAASHESEKEGMAEYLNRAKSKALRRPVNEVTNTSFNPIATYE